jgi:hypothetical protein
VYFVPGVAGASFGRSIANLGDFNGDGVGDVALSAHNFDSANGRAYVVFGRNNTGPTTLGFAATENLATYTTAQGMRFDSAGVPGFANARFGWAMDAADVNGDGRRDLLVGATLYQTPSRAESGAVVGIYGPGANPPAYARTLDTLLGNGAAFLMQGPRANGGIGWAVANVGDIDGDERFDFAVGSPIGVIPNFPINAGNTIAVYGRASGSPFIANGDLAGLPLQRGTEWIGEAVGDNSGWSISGGGDFNGDGRDDLLIGAPRADGTPGANSGITYLLLDNRRLVMFCDGLEAPEAGACGATN